MRPRQHRVSPALRYRTLERDRFTCQGCGLVDDDRLPSHTKEGDLIGIYGVYLSIDHKTPRSRGGDDSPRNLWTLCTHCNSDKGTRTRREWVLSKRRRSSDYLERRFTRIHGEREETCG